MRLDEKMIASIVEEVLREIGMGAGGGPAGGSADWPRAGSGTDGRPGVGWADGRRAGSGTEGQPGAGWADGRQAGDQADGGRFGPRRNEESAQRQDNDLHDITSPEEKAKPTLEHPMDPEALSRMMGKTTARIGVGKAGPRERTRTWLTLRADHALARDSVFSDVDEALIGRLNLVSVQSMCRDRNEHITRPDLGRRLDREAQQKIISACKEGVDVQLIASDGLSSKAIEANLENILPVIVDGLNMRGISTGPAVFVKYGRVAVEDAVSELLHPKVVCILIGERPGLGTAESMSAYICYQALVGQPEARRTVVSNIYSGGTNAVEAGAYVAELIEKILKEKASGVDLKH